jgi:hypothetical protein
MKKQNRLSLRLLCIVVLLFCGGIAAVHASDTDANLNITKVILSPNPSFVGDEVSWRVTVWNNGPANATNISVAENSSGLTGLQSFHAEVSSGTYDESTHQWNISEIENGTSATLILNTTFQTIGDKVNQVNITSLNETDPDTTDNNATAVVRINATPPKVTGVSLEIKPETLNLKSNGVFTVFVHLTGLDPEQHIDLANSTLTCGGAEPVRWMISEGKGGTLSAKFQRADLIGLEPGKAVKITCSGTLSIDGQTIVVEGNDTIRILDGGWGLQSFFAKILAFLGALDRNGDGEIGADDGINVTPPLNLSEIRNMADLKKELRTTQVESASPDRDDKWGTNVMDEEKPQKRNTEKEFAAMNKGDEEKNRDQNGKDKGEKGNGHQKE